MKIILVWCIYLCFRIYYNVFLYCTYIGWVLRYAWILQNKSILIIMFLIEIGVHFGVLFYIMYIHPFNGFLSIVMWFAVALFVSLLVYAVFLLIFMFIAVKFNDYWHIKTEMILHVTTVLILALSIAITIVLVSKGIISNFRILLDVTTLMTVVWYPFNWINSIIFVEIMNYGYRKLIKKFKMDHGNHDKRMTFNSIVNLMQNNKGYELFMKHLQKEFASGMAILIYFYPYNIQKRLIYIENFLYVTTLCQFQELLISLKILDVNDKSKLIKQQRIIVADSVPKLITTQPTSFAKRIKNEIIKRKSGKLSTPVSPALTDNNSVATTSDFDIELSALTQDLSINEETMILINNIFIDIYKKYIESYKAKYQINLPSQMRYNLEKEYELRINNIKLNKFTSLWNELKISGKEIFKLLQDSHSRFDYHSSINF